MNRGNVRLRFRLDRFHLKKNGLNFYLIIIILVGIPVSASPEFVYLKVDKIANCIKKTT